MSKKYLLGLPLFNLIVIIVWFGLGNLESSFIKDTSSAPIGVTGFIVLVLFYGGFLIGGLVLGILYARKSEISWNQIIKITILSFVIIEIAYLALYFLTSNNHTYILRDTLIISLEQTIGYFFGNCIGRSIRKVNDNNQAMK